MVQWVLMGVGGVWPLVTFAGGLGFSVLLPLAALLCIRSGAPGFKFRLYMFAILMALEFIAASARWSPRPINLIDIDLAKGSFAVRFEVARVGLCLMWTALLMSAARTLSPNEARRVVKVVTIAILLQLFIVATLAIFEGQMLELFSPAMSNQGEGVQNIARNGIIMGLAAPFLIVGFGRTMSFTRALFLEIGVFVVVVAVLLTRGVHGGIVALIVGFLSVGVIRLLPRYGFRALGLGVASIIMTAPVVFGFLAGNAVAAASSSSADWRLLIWRRVTQLIQEDPIFGQGLGVLRTIKETIPDGPLKGELIVPNHAHNMILQLWAETGFVGAALVSLAIVTGSWRMPQPRVLGVSGYLAAALAGGFVSVALVSFDLWNDWWWACAGLLATFIVVMARAETIDDPGRILPTPEPPAN